MYLLTKKPDGRVGLEIDDKFIEIRMSPLSLLHEMMAKPIGYPQTGIPVSELRTALARIESAPEITDKRVMGIIPHEDGYLLITTGMQIAPLAGGGYKVLLKKTDQDWEIVESCCWIS